MKLIKLLLALCVLTVSTAFAYDKVIYGEDNRVDIYDSASQQFVDLAKSTAAMITNGNIKSNADGSYYVKSGTLQSRGICASERFSEQLSAANCSGFLVASDIIVTAGHCYSSSSACSTYKWVFDFKSSSTGRDEKIQVAKDSVYGCKEVIKKVQTYYDKNDYAVIKLDRPVVGYKPLKFRKRGKVANNASIVVIGSPSGLPTKIADGANVRTNSNRVYFTTNLDTYGGNSGSAVFNVDTGEVEGILVRGATDYVRSSEGCMISNVCTNDGCRGEDVTRITKVKEIMNM